MKHRRQPLPLDILTQGGEQNQKGQGCGNSSRKELMPIIFKKILEPDTRMGPKG